VTAHCRWLAVAELFCREANQIDPSRMRRPCPIALGEQHLRQVLKAYARYYNTARTHRSLDKDAPISRPGARRAAMLLLADEVSPHNN
jgi:hypothetical protein